MGRRKQGGGGGIVVVFAWMSSQEKHLKNYVQLYASLGWDSLVCHSEFLNMYGFELISAFIFFYLIFVFIFIMLGLDDSFDLL